MPRLLLYIVKLNFTPPVAGEGPAIYYLTLWVYVHYICFEHMPIIAGLPMPRQKKCRFIQSQPDVLYFKPRGIPLRELDECVLTMDEVEAIRLADLEGRSHEDAASEMGISRTTFGRIVASARRSVADALLNGKSIRMQHAAFAVLADKK